MKEEENQKDVAINDNTNNFEEVPVYQEVEPQKKQVRTDSYFDGGLLELIGWRILAFLIIGVTLGIATPWAKCMLYSYKIKHTVYNGKRLKFVGTGGDLFVNMFKWLFFTIITLGIYALFIPIKKTRWVISNIHFEDEKYVKEESFFDGKTIQLIGINILSKIITVFSLGLLYPFAVCLKLRWINKHTVINRKKLVFDGKGFGLWGRYILWYLLTIITFGIFSLWIPILMLKWKAKHVHIKTVGEEEKKDRTALIIIPIAIIIIIGVAALIYGVIVPKVTQMIDDGEIPIFSKETVADRISSEDRYTINESKSSSMMAQEVVREEKPTKTSITVGGYTLKFGTYKGQVIQGVWDDVTMTSTARYTDVILKLTENNITINGESGTYTTSGNKIIWKGQDYILEVTGNNKIRYNAENCPELVYQGN